VNDCRFACRDKTRGVGQEIAYIALAIRTETGREDFCPPHALVSAVDEMKDGKSSGKETGEMEMMVT
jgi:hypothetical protein